MDFRKQWQRELVWIRQNRYRMTDLEYRTCRRVTLWHLDASRKRRAAGRADAEPQP